MHKTENPRAKRVLETVGVLKLEAQNAKLKSTANPVKSIVPVKKEVVIPTADVELKPSKGGFNLEHVLDILKTPVHIRQPAELVTLARNLRHLKAFATLSSFVLLQLSGVLLLEVVDSGRSLWRSDNQICSNMVLQVK